MYERILIDACIIKEDMEQMDEAAFTTEAYLAGYYDATVIDAPKNLTNENYGVVKRQDLSDKKMAYYFQVIDFN